MTAIKKVRVALSFPPNFFDGLTKPPLVMQPGEVLEVFEKEKSEEWPAFVFVVNEKGGRGWVPKRCLKGQGKKAVATKRYDTTTLNPSKGEVLTVLDEDKESGWLWCRDENGRTGWFCDRSPRFLLRLANPGPL